MAGSKSLRRFPILLRKAFGSSAVVSNTSTASPLRQSSINDARTSSICSWRSRWLQRRSRLDRSRYRDSVSCDGANRASISWPLAISTLVNCRSSAINSRLHCVPAAPECDASPPLGGTTVRIERFQEFLGEARYLKHEPFSRGEFAIGTGLALTISAPFLFR